MAPSEPSTRISLIFFGNYVAKSANKESVKEIGNEQKKSGNHQCNPVAENVFNRVQGLNGWNRHDGVATRSARIVVGLKTSVTRKVKKITHWYKDCRMHFTIKTGTVPLRASKTCTQNWVVAIYSVLTARKSVSSLQLSKELNVQQRTAWHMLHRIREICQQEEFKLFW